MLNPFDKPLGSRLEAADLQLLVTRGVSEGFHVEYKRELPAHGKVARSIASFANTYGGWYIVGVTTDGHNVATEVPGFALSTCPDPISVVRDVAKTHIDPVPVFHAEVVNVSPGQAVLVVRVPEDQETPFLTKDGRIYRRNHDSSDPVPETSRYTVDQLVERGRRQRRRFRKFARDPRALDPRDHTPWLRVFIAPRPVGSVFRPEILGADGVAELIQRSQRPLPISLLESAAATANMPLAVAQVTPHSVILRPGTKREDLHSAVVELDVIGRARILLPLQAFDGIARWELDTLRSEQVRRVLDERADAGAVGLAFVDIGSAWLRIAALVAYYRAWLGNPPEVAGVTVAIEVGNAFRCVPFLDDDAWAEHVHRFGLPVVMADRVRAPARRTVGFEFENDEDLWMHICGWTGMTLGLPNETFGALLGGAIVHAMERRAPSSDGTVF